MGELESETLLNQFATSNRAGRRNAVATIDVDAVDPTGEKLAGRFAQMGTEQSEQSQKEEPSTSQAQSTASQER